MLPYSIFFSVEIVIKKALVLKMMDRTIKIKLKNVLEIFGQKLGSQFDKLSKWRQGMQSRHDPRKIILGVS